MPEILSFGAAGWGDELVLGALTSIGLALVTLPSGVALGLALALLRQGRSKALRRVSGGFVIAFQGIPELLTILIVYYGLQMLLNAVFVPLTGAGLELSSFLAGVIALSLVFAAFASDVFLSALNAIPRGQFEAADALGLTYWQRLRLVVWPQLLRLSLPGLSNLWMVLLKETSLVSVIALHELMRQTRLAAAATKEFATLYAACCVLYLLLAMISSLGLARIERAFPQRDQRAA